MLQHKNVYTVLDNLLLSGCYLTRSPVSNQLGTATKEGGGPLTNMIDSPENLPYEVYNIERGGQATYHGPGQIVLYPILDLNFFEKDIHMYLRKLEDVVLITLQKLGIPGSRRIDGLTGVWVKNSKIAAIGIKISRWVTMHGVSVNVHPDLRYFSNIVPCGISDPDKSVGSICQYIPNISMEEVSDVLLASFQNEFQIEFSEYLSGNDAFNYINMQSYRKMCSEI